MSAGLSTYSAKLTQNMSSSSDIVLMSSFIFPGP